MSYQCIIYGPGINLNLSLTTPDDVDALTATLHSIRTKLARSQTDENRNQAITERAESLLGIKSTENVKTPKKR
jgi:hypothetical protein